jgi:type II restriction/modification system DNA methylase subunit YeeA
LHLRELDNIQHRDAILAYDAKGNPVEPEWPQADFIIGNPPFLGDKKMRGELGDKYVDDLRQLFAERIPGASDLVCYWFEKARDAVDSGATKRVGLLATQGIRGGANREVLDRIKESGDIFWAESDRNWVLEGANVHVSMVGFDDGTETSRILDGQAVEEIYSDLSSSVDLTGVAKIAENSGVAFIGTQKGVVGQFEISA